MISLQEHLPKKKYLAIKAAHKYEVIHIIIYLLWVAAQRYVLCAMCYVLLTSHR